MQSDMDGNYSCGSSVSFMEPNTKGLLPDSFKTLQNKDFIVLNAFI